MRAQVKPLLQTHEFEGGRFVIEPVQPDDVRPVMRLAWKETHRLIPAPFFEDIAREQAAYFRVVRDRSSGLVQGFIIAARQPGTRDDFLLLAVEPSLVGQGVRRALLHEVQAHLKEEGRRGVSIGVPIQDKAMLEFFRREGYDLIQVPPMGDVEDRLFLAKSL